MSASVATPFRAGVRRREVHYILTAVAFTGERIPIAVYTRYVDARADGNVISEHPGWHADVRRVSVPLS
jgi:hypothetical protein